MRLALTDLFKAQWTDEIHEEWIDALLRVNKFKRKGLERVRDLMDAHVRDAKVYGYEYLMRLLSYLILMTDMLLQQRLNLLELLELPQKPALL